MAHRPMPQPGSAGPSPVPQASVRPTSGKPASDKSISGKPISERFCAVPQTPERRKRSSFDYWDFIFGTLVIAAVLILAWRMAGIFLTKTRIPDHPPAALTRNEAANSATQKAPAGVSPITQPHVQPSRPAVQLKKNEHRSDPVIVQAIVGVDGKVKQAHVLRGNPALAEAALATVRQLNFTPYAPNGTAVEFETEVAVSGHNATAVPHDRIQISIPQQPAQETGQSTVP